MNKEEYLDNMDWSPLKELLAVRGINARQASRGAGLTQTFIACVTGKHYIPSTNSLAQLCSSLEVGFNEIVRFTGFEVKDRYKEPYYRPYKGEQNDSGLYVSYEPLRSLFYHTYGEDNWKQKMHAFFDIVDGVELTDKQKVQIDKMLECAKGHHLPKSGRAVHSSGTSYPDGMNSYQRGRIHQNLNVDFRLIYNICEKLGCTPDYVVSYR